MQETIQTTHELMDTYVRLMSQTEHTQRLLLDCEWEMQKVGTGPPLVVALAAGQKADAGQRVDMHRTRPRCGKQKKHFSGRDRRKRHG